MYTVHSSHNTNINYVVHRKYCKVRKWLKLFKDKTKKTKNKKTRKGTVAQD